MDKTIDTPSREIDLGNIPVHLRTALRRALEFEARAPAQVGRGSGAVRRAAAGHRGRVLRRPPHPRAATRGALGRGWRRGERPRAPPAPADAERRPGDRPFAPPGARRCRSRRRYREKHARGAKRRPGLYPALVVRASTTGARRSWPRMQAARSPCTARSAGAAPLRGHRPGYQDPPLDRLSLRCAGPSGPAERGVRSATA